MKKTSKQILAFVLAAGVMTAMFTGCNKDGGKSTVKTNETTVKETPAQSYRIAPEGKEITLSWWLTTDSTAATVVKDYSEMESFKEVSRLTGVKINFVHVSQADQREKFNLMIAANELSDVMQYFWGTADGGAQRYVDQGYIMKLNDLIDKNAPNLKNLINTDPVIKKQWLAPNNGDILFVPHMKAQASQSIVHGLQIRQDWLDKLGLKIPETVDDLYTVLKAFKEKDPNGNGKADEIPFSAPKMEDVKDIRRLPYAFGTSFNFQLKDGKVVYGPTMPEFKEFLKFTTKLYAEGLLDPDFVTQNIGAVDKKVTSDTVGVWYGYGASSLGKYLDAKKDDKNFKISGVPALKSSVTNGKAYVVETDYIRKVYDSISLAISSKNKYPVETMKLIDFMFSDKGRTIMNFGKESVSYTLDSNGKPKWVDDIVNNPATPKTTAVFKHIPVSGIFMEDAHFPTLYQRPEAFEAMKVWAKADPSRAMPVGLTVDASVAQRDAALRAPIRDYVYEMFNKMVLGKESIDKFDTEYLTRIKQMSVDEMIKNRQDALDKYNK